MASIRKCKIRECDNFVNAYDLCLKHYKRFKRHGDPEKTVKAPHNLIKTCIVETCNNKFHAKMYCYKHYYFFVKYNDPLYGHTKRLQTPEERRNSRRNTLIKYKAKRAVAIKQQTPSWANSIEIQNFYRNCPKGHSVDHIVPIMGKIVSGLHVINNLQYLLKSDNSKKSNKLLKWEN